jgi:hypothetical protein
MGNTADEAASPGPGSLDPPYRVGNKKPPLHTQFKPGQSGNPSGRPKVTPDFGMKLLKELNKTVAATLNGQSVKVQNYDLVVKSLVKDAITEGPQSKALLLKSIRTVEAQLAAKAEVQANAKAQQSESKFDWNEEKEKLLQEIEEACAEIKQASKDEDNQP